MWLKWIQIQIWIGRKKHTRVVYLYICFKWIQIQIRFRIRIGRPWMPIQIR